MGAQVYDPSVQKTGPGPVTIHDFKANLDYLQGSNTS